ncbi:HYR domain-containing protein [Candidatus Woesearchaeota archaeon]|nr:HYR domain-containing protein [Candidatus Woesearchaeota archaeon]
MKPIVIAFIVFVALAGVVSASKGPNMTVMHFPDGNLTLELGQNFTMTCAYTSNGTGAAARANLSFLFNGAALMNATTGLNLSGDNPEEDVDANDNETRIVFARTPGTYDVYCAASDDRHKKYIQNSTNVTVTVFSAPSAPAITLVSPENTTQLNDTTSINLSFNAIDDRNASFGCTTDLNGTLITGKVMNGTTVIGANISYGTYAWSVNCSDGTRSNVSANWQFTVSDTLPPVIDAVTNLTVEATGNATSVSYTIPNATDAKDGAVSVLCAPAGSFALGNTTVTCNATDTSDNIATTAFSIRVVDTAAPSLAINSPTATTYANASVLVNITATDALGVGVIEYRYNDSSGNASAWADASVAFTRDFTGTTTLEARATDTNGNIATASVTFSIELPVLSTEEPVAKTRKKKSSKPATEEIEIHAAPELPITTLTPRAPVTEELTADVPVILLDTLFNETDLAPITALAITDTDAIVSRRTVLVAIVVAFGAAIMLFLFLRKKKPSGPEGTNIIADHPDEPLIPFTMLEDADQVLDRIMNTKTTSWKKLFAHYPPLVVHTCKLALKDANAKPTPGTLPQPADYIGAATFGRLVRMLASNKLAGELSALPKHTHADYHEVAPAAEQELAILRHVKLTKPSDVDRALTLIRHGKGVVLIDISGLENDAELKSALKKIKRTAEANDGAVIGVGTHGLLATHTIPIHTGGATHGTV